MSSQRRKSRKAHFSAPSHLRRKILSSHLSKDLRTKYDVRAVPVRKGDTVKVMRGSCKGREGKVQAVYRKRWALHVEKLTREKTNGTFSFFLILPRSTSPNPSSPIPSPSYSSEARQRQKGSFGKKEESCQRKEQAQGRISRSRLSHHNAPSFIVQITNLLIFLFLLFLFIYI